jgi:N6-adenosine-specific RNA methylase IME4
VTKYRTIVADPPWEYGKFNSFSTSGPTRMKGRVSSAARALSYPTMTVAEISALPVPMLAADDAHLYLWTTSRYLRSAFDVAEAWGFSYSTLLTWVKAPMGSGMGGAFHPTTEFVLFARRGSLAPLARAGSTHFHAKRPYDDAGKPIHSGKPDAFLDLVEQVSPGPRVELFARRQRLGWDTWGNEALNHVELSA